MIENAIKFSAEEGILRISVKHGREGRYLVEVYNEGKGVSKEDLPFVFDRFYKSDKSRGLDKAGVGLGLYIVKTIIDANGESISVQSEQDVFCRFSFTLRASETEAGRKNEK